MADKKLDFGFSTSADMSGIRQIKEGLKEIAAMVDQIVAKSSKMTFGKSDNKSSPDNFTNTVDKTTESVGKLNTALMTTDKTMVHGTQKTFLQASRQIQSYTKDVGDAASATGRLHAAMGAAFGQGANPAGSMFGAAAGFGAGGGGVYGGGGARYPGAPGGPPGLPAAGYSNGIPGGGGGGPPGGGGGGGFFNNPFFNMPGSKEDWKALGKFAANASTIGTGVLASAGTIIGGEGALQRQEVFGSLEAQVRAQAGRDRLFSMIHSNAAGYGNVLFGKGLALNRNRQNPNSTMIDPRSAGPDWGGEGGDFMGDALEQSQSIAQKGLAARKIGNYVDYAKAGGKAVGSVVGGIAMSPFTGGLSVPAGIAGGMSGVDDIISAEIQRRLQNKQIAQGEVEAQKGEMQSHALGLLQQLGGAPLAAASAAQSGTAGLRVAASRAMGGGGNAMRLMGQGAGMGFDLGESTALGAGLAGQFGARLGNQLGQPSMALANKGFDASSAGAIMGQMAQSGTSGRDMLRQVMREGVKQGMGELDVKFFEKIGEAVASAAIGVGGANQSIAMGAALMSGLNNKSSMTDVNANIRGMQLANQQQQQNPFMASRALVDAAGILGPNATGEEIEGLADASIEDLVAQSNKGSKKSEKGNEALNIQGVTRDQARERLNRIVNRTGSVLSYGNSAPAKRLQSAIAKHGSFQAALETHDQSIVADAAWLAQRRLGGADLNAFKGEMRIFGGLGEKQMSRYLNNGGKESPDLQISGMGEKNKQTSQTLQDLSHYAKLMSEAAAAMKDKLGKDLEAMQALRDNQGLAAPEQANAAIQKFTSGAHLMGDVSEEVARKMAAAWGIDITRMAAKANKDARDLENKQNAAQKDKAKRDAQHKGWSNR